MKRELEVAREVALEAGRILLEVYATAFQVVEKPGGGGPVTEADQRANAFIVDALQRAFPTDSVVAEESSEEANEGRAERCWYVDPMDGTAEFVERNGMFAVQIGLAVRGEAVVGVVYAPVTGKLYAGIVGGGCVLEQNGETRALKVTPVGPDVDPGKLRLVVSRSHKSKKTELIRRELGITQVIEHGSVGLKCGLVAEGAADLYLHPSDRSYRWDSCGPEAILRAAGGDLRDFGGTRYRYDGSELRNHRGIIAGSTGALAIVGPVAARVAREAGLVPPS